jgi:hypothetical protein
MYYYDIGFYSDGDYAIYRCSVPSPSDCEWLIPGTWLE